MFRREPSPNGSTASRAVALDTPETLPALSAAAEKSGAEGRLSAMRERLLPHLLQRVRPGIAQSMPQKELARLVSDVVIDHVDDEPDSLTLNDQRQLVSALMTDLLSVIPENEPLALPSDTTFGDLSKAVASRGAGAIKGKAGPASAASAAKVSIDEAKRKVKPLVMERIDFAAASALEHEALVKALTAVVTEIRDELHLQLNQFEQTELVRTLVDDMVGLGPLEPLLSDETVTDIMVNGAHQVYVERGGKLELTEVKFQDDAHVMNVATRIVTKVGRRVDESSPICDARLQDGSRVNVIIPPLAIDGPSISIRKFSRRRITLDMMGERGNMSPRMARLLKIAARCRLNVLISGGTGSGKTTLLNALSQLIDHGDRIVTIEDAAELQLQQPHVVRLETRPANLEGKGEVSMRGLVKNALRMRPDRIILGEVRGPEAVDMLQAMNTGHEGSMCTLHANKPRDALVRLENMIGMAGINLPSKAVRTQIASAVDLIVQVSRMRDGARRVTDVVEVVGMEGDVIITQDLFNYHFHGEDDRGRLRGDFTSAGVRPHFLPKAEYFGLGQALLELM